MFITLNALQRSQRMGVPFLIYFSRARRLVMPVKANLTKVRPFFIMKLKDIHIGKIIEEKFKEKRQDDKTFNKAEFARRIKIDRSTVYLLFQKKSIDTEMLINISEVLGYDFLNEVYREKPSQKLPTVIVGIAISPEQLQKLELPEGFIKLMVR